MNLSNYAKGIDKIGKLYDKDKSGLIWSEIRGLYRQGEDILSNSSESDNRISTGINPLTSSSYIYKDFLDGQGADQTVDINKRVSFYILKTLYDLYKCDIKSFDKIIRHIKSINNYIETELVDHLEYIVDDLVDKKEYISANDKENSIKALNTFRFVIYDVIRALTVLYSDDVEFIAHINNLKDYNMDNWVSLDDVPVNKCVKFKSFKFKGVDNKAGNGEGSCHTINYEVGIKSAKDLTVEAMRVLNIAIGGDLLNEDALSQVKLSDTIKPSNRPDGKKSPYDIGNNIYIETGLLWTRRVNMIKELYKAFGVNSSGIKVQIDTTEK